LFSLHLHDLHRHCACSLFSLHLHDLSITLANVAVAKTHHRRLLLRRRLEVPASEVLEVAFTRKKPASATAPTMTRIPGVVEKNDASDAGPATLGPAVIGTSDFNVE
jgi:hypothetical protein